MRDLTLIDEHLTYENGALHWKTTNKEHQEGEAVKGWYHQSKNCNHPTRMIRINNSFFTYAQAVYYLHYKFIPKLINYKDGDRTNHSIENLEPTSQKIINWQKPKLTNREYTSKYKGVYLNHSGKYRVTITKDGKRYSCGVYLNEGEAALAYNKKASELFGSYARLNIIED